MEGSRETSYRALRTRVFSSVASSVTSSSAHSVHVPKSEVGDGTVVANARQALLGEWLLWQVYIVPGKD